MREGVCVTEIWEVPQLPMFYMGPGRRGSGQRHRKRARDSASNKYTYLQKEKRHDRVNIQRMFCRQKVKSY